MAQLWGGRFTKETDKLVYNFNASISFDQKFYRQDIRGSIAHVTMLAASGILTDIERDQIIAGLNGILNDVENGSLQITSEYEDIHSFVEANLIDRIGDVGKKLHTGRSRNDQVALDMKLYVRDEIVELKKLIFKLMSTIHVLMKEHIDTYMPGFTHLQKAQPITLAHHLGAYMEMFKRDYGRMNDIYDRMNYCPLGSGALAGTTYPLDRELTASLLDFYGPTLNSMDSVADRDYCIELLSAMSTIMMHLSRFSEEIIIWNSNEYQFVELDDSYSTGMIATMTVNKPKMEASAKNGFTNATDAADYLVNHGVPFRDAHGIVGQLVLKCIDENISLDQLSLDEYKAICPVFEDDIYTAISMEECVQKRNTIGAPGHTAMQNVIDTNGNFLKWAEKDIINHNKE